jgi:SHS2 domain-containing protein
MFESFDHTGDIGLTIRASSLEALFMEAATALMETIVDVGNVRATIAEPVDVVAPQLDLLLVEWLSELLYRFEARGLLAARTDVGIDVSAQGCRLNGTLHGETLDPRHQVKVLVKAVTYHALSVQHTAAGWEARVVLDV